VKVIVRNQFTEHAMPNSRKTVIRWKKSSERRKHCALAVVTRNQKKNRPAADPLPGGAGRSKF